MEADMDNSSKTIQGLVINNSGDVFIYRLIDPETGDTHYIGKSVSPHQRLRQHLKETDSPKSYWVQSLREKGLEPILEIIDVCPAQKADEVEHRWIFEYRKNKAKLFNVYPHAPENDERFGKYNSLEDWEKVLYHAKRVSKEKIHLESLLDWCDFAQQNGADIFFPEYDCVHNFLSEQKNGFREIAIQMFKFYFSAVSDLFPEKQLDDLVSGEFLYEFVGGIQDNVILHRVISNIPSKSSSLSQLYSHVDKALIDEYKLLRKEAEQLPFDSRRKSEIGYANQFLYRVAYYYNSLQSRDLNILRAFFFSNATVLVLGKSGKYYVRRDHSTLIKRDILFDSLLNILGNRPTHEYLTGSVIKDWIRKNTKLITLCVGSVSDSPLDCITKCLASYSFELRADGIIWQGQGAIYRVEPIEYWGIDYAK